MKTDTDRHIEKIYQKGLEGIKTIYHFHRPKCVREGCWHKLSVKDEKRRHTICEACYKAERKSGADERVV